MKKMTKQLLLLSLLSLSLSACGTLFDKDNTPQPTALANFTPEVQVQPVWGANTGRGVGTEYLKLAPAVTHDQIFTASKLGAVTAVNKATGKRLWSANVGAPISGGVGANDNLVFVGTRRGELVALRQLNGVEAWRTHVSSETLAVPVANNNLVLVKSIDGNLQALSTENGHEQWHYQQTEPALILRGASAPQLTARSTVVGFEDGTLIKAALNDGNILWNETVAVPSGAFAIQRMVDIDADPIIVGNRVYAVTYQGKVAALDLATGRQFWNYDISSYSGITADSNQVYVTDAVGRVWAFNAKTGDVNWQQTKLIARNLTGPAVMNNSIVVADGAGYLHWLNKQDGHFVARTRVDSSGILATPVVDNGNLYVYAKNGYLAAYRAG